MNINKYLLSFAFYIIVLILYYRSSKTDTTIEPSILPGLNTYFDSKPRKISTLKVDETIFDKNETWVFFQNLYSESKYNMFFFETKMDKKYLTERQLCSIESAAKNNPNAVINLYSSDAQIHPSFLKQYPNIKVHKLVAEHILKDTPLEKWYKLKKEIVINSPFAVVHTSDILRVAILWKIGGYYTDFDTLTVRSVEPLLKYPGVGYLFEANNHSMNNAIMNFPRHHPFLTAAMDDIVRGYKPKIWGHHGPLLMIRTFKKHCKTDQIYKKLMFDKIELENDAKQNNVKRKKYLCDVHILENNFFNPHTIQTTHKLFKANFTMSIDKCIDVFTIHLFNTNSEKYKIERNSFYEYMARIHCPIAYRVILKYGL